MTTRQPPGSYRRSPHWPAPLLACPLDAGRPAERRRTRTSDAAPRRVLPAKGTVSAGNAIGRIAVEQITPYPPEIPGIVPGERITVAGGRSPIGTRTLTARDADLRL